MNAKSQSSLKNHVSGQSNRPLSKPAHSLSYQVIASELNVDVQDGLENEVAANRFHEHGPNELGDGHRVNPGKILIRQFANSMTLVSCLQAFLSLEHH